MKKYLPIQINGEWCLRETGNPYQMNGDLCELEMYHDFEMQAIHTAKPIINYDGREWYEEKELSPVSLIEIANGKYMEINNPQNWRDTPIISGWKYIGEKPVEKIDTIFDYENVTQAAEDFLSKIDGDYSDSDEAFIGGAQFGSDYERTRITSIITAAMDEHPSNAFLYEHLLTKINS